jgi:hypothetical protein
MNKSTQLFLYLMAISILIGSCTVMKNSIEERLPQKETADNGLYAEIFHMDSILFNAFNSRDIEKLKTLFSEDLEFYHDKGGLAGYEQTMDNFLKLFENNKTTGLRRDLIDGSLEIYPIKDYGAIEVCLHRFCHQENGKNDCGTFKNVMVWEKKNEQWKVTRVISYDH